MFGGVIYCHSKKSLNLYSAADFNTVFSQICCHQEIFVKMSRKLVVVLLALTVLLNGLFQVSCSDDESRRRRNDESPEGEWKRSFVSYAVNKQHKGQQNKWNYGGK